MATVLKSIPGQRVDRGPETVEDQIFRLELRLEDGFSRIGEAMGHGIEVDNWEQLWIELLREYERLNDDVAAAA